MAFRVLHIIDQRIVASYPNEAAVCGNTAGSLECEHTHEHDSIIRSEELLPQAKPASQRNSDKGKD